MRSRRRREWALLGWLAMGVGGGSAPHAAAQQGDMAGEEQHPLPPELVVPAAPARTAADQLATFRLPPGLSIELVATEPLVRDPVAIAWDASRRLWVCEMRGFMPDVDGTGEAAPVGSIAVLRDSDGDGRLDERRVFLDELVLPRAIAPVRGGLLYIEPPRLIFCRDVDGDGRGDGPADLREVYETGLGGIHSPEHAINGLLTGLDNWILCANHPFRYRFQDGRLERQRTAGGGQWGVAKDDLGRVYFNTNSDALRGDPYPSHYAVRNPGHGTARGVNVRYAHDQRVWPARVTPGVNRGYREGLLHEGKLTRFTAACAPWILRGDGLSASYRGDAFVCEPSGNLIKRYRMSDGPEGIPQAEAHAPGVDFLTSTDERFRPVNLRGGPDGALYVVDMYRGVIQHRLFVTSFLRAQIEERGLEEPRGLGRIWRIVEDGVEPSPGPDLADASWTELAACLSHPSGWWRDTAQRLFVEEGADSRDAIEVLHETFAASDDPLGRLHILWSLEGMGQLSDELLAAGLDDPDERVVLAAVRLSERWLGSSSDRFTLVLAGLAVSASPALRLQILLSLGAARRDAADRVSLRILAERSEISARTSSAVLSGLEGRELIFLETLLDDDAWQASSPGRPELVALLARAIGRSGRTAQIERTLAAAADLAPDRTERARRTWQRAAIVEGLLDARTPGPTGESGFLHLARRPDAFDLLHGGASESAVELLGSLAWPGRADIEIPVVTPLSEREQARFDAGRTVFQASCATCHQPSGLGEAGKAPPLRGSKLVLGSPRRLAQIVGWGLSGEIEVDGETWNADMPAFQATAADMASLLTYLRREWGHGADPVAPAFIETLRAEVGERPRPFTPEELGIGLPR